jgi:hypothetical protein
VTRRATGTRGTPPAPARDAWRGSELVAALERAWTAIRVLHPEVPPVVLVVLDGHTRTTPINGLHTADAWTVARGAGPAATEIAIAGERLADGAEAVLSTLIHEAAHALARARDVKDTSRGGRYHNAKYADLARSMTLDVQQDDRHGWTITSPTDATRAAYGDVLADLDAAIGGSFRRSRFARKPPPEEGDEGGEEGGDEGDGDEPPPTNGKRWTLVCACEDTRRIGAVPSVALRAPIVCGACGVRFQCAELLAAVELLDGEAAEPWADAGDDD